MPLSRNLGTLTSWNLLGHFGPVMGLLYLSISRVHISKVDTLMRFEVCTAGVAEDSGLG